MIKKSSLIFDRGVIILKNNKKNKKSFKRLLA